ncbi:MAG: GCN5-like N-acetyltransferase [Paenibacillaceae bacterium]|nr:GCN5-like N-acetyltransferase [Paenibacillaceae bacterium]
MSSIRTLRTSELEDSLQLSQFAFQYEISPLEKDERLSRMKPEEIWGMFSGNGELEAQLTLLPLSTYICGREFAMGGLAGVATWPEHRRKGKVAALLAHALQVMREQGQTISFLHPFQFQFYRRFGWETYTEYKKYELSVAQLPRFEPVGGQVVRTADPSVLASVYDEYARRFNGMLVRTPQWWEQRIMQRKNAGGASAVYYNDDGKPKGYMLYKVRDYTMTVNEWVAHDAQAERELWRFIANHDSMLGSQGKIILQTEPGNRLTSLLRDPRIKQEIMPYFMARLVDAQAFLHRYPFAAGAPGELSLFITDAHAPWNQGQYKLRLAADGTARADFLEGTVEAAQGTDGDNSISCSIGILTSLLLGYERPSFWHRNGLLQGSASALAYLEAIIPRHSPYLMDFF